MPAKIRNSDETKKFVRDLWMKGHSALYIGDMMGRTRRSIIGIVWRLGLVGVERPANPAPYQQLKRNQYTGRKPPKPLKAILGQKRSDGAPVTIKDIPMPDPSVASRTSYRDGGKIGLMDLQWNSCRWPLGDPQQWDQFGYCGAQTNGGACPYCVIHKKIAFYNPRSTGGHFVLKGQVATHGK